MKQKTNISVKNNLGYRVNVDMEVGENKGFSSGDILDANATAKLIEDKIGEVVGGASSSVDTLKEIETELGKKQASLVSGTNIKTINGTSILGEGDLSEVINAMIAAYIESMNSETEPESEPTPESEP